jgi:hypothetical protein
LTKANRLSINSAGLKDAINVAFSLELVFVALIIFNSLAALLVFWETGGIRNRHSVSFLVLELASLFAYLVSTSVQGYHVILPFASIAVDHLLIAVFLFVDSIITSLFVKDIWELRSLRSQSERTIKGVEIRKREVEQVQEKLDKIAKDIQNVQDDIVLQHREFTRKREVIHAD